MFKELCDAIVLMVAYVDDLRYVREMGRDELPDRWWWAQLYGEDALRAESESIHDPPPSEHANHDPRLGGVRADNPANASLWQADAEPVRPGRIGAAA
jgi:hypothetical protein